MVIGPLVQPTLWALAWTRHPAALLGGAHALALPVALALPPGLVLTAWAVARRGSARSRRARSGPRTEPTPVSPRQGRP